VRRTTSRLRAQILDLLEEPSTPSMLASKTGADSLALRAAMVTLQRQGHIERVDGLWRLYREPPPARTLMVLGMGPRRDWCVNYSECLLGWARARECAPCRCPAACAGYVARDMTDERDLAMRGEGYQP
jgi:hypothetical protein